MNIYYLFRNQNKILKYYYYHKLILKTSITKQRQWPTAVVHFVTTADLRNYIIIKITSVNWLTDHPVNVWRLTVSFSCVDARAGYGRI